MGGGARHRVKRRATPLRPQATPGEVSEDILGRGMRLAVCGEGCTPCEDAGTGASALLCLQAARRLVETGISHINHSRRREWNPIEFSYYTSLAGAVSRTAAARWLSTSLRYALKQNPLVNRGLPLVPQPHRSARGPLPFFAQI